MTQLQIVEYTDPGCPWAFSAEPTRRRLEWLFGDQLTWEVRLVGLAASGDEYEARGFTTAVLSRALAAIAADHGMPIDDRLRPRMAATLPACRAAVAVRRHRPERARALIRRLAVLQFAGDLLDDPATITRAIAEVGLEPREVAAWIEERATADALEADLGRARHPEAAALAQPERLARWDGGWRYTCPSYEFVHPASGARFSLPGFQQLRAYEAAIANLAPVIVRAADPDDAEAVLTHFDEPLATVEIAAVMNCSPAQARERLGAAGARFAPVGADGYWTI